MPHAVVLGGTGVVGRGVASRLLDDGWQVTITGRDAAHMPAALASRGAAFAVSNRDSRRDVQALLGTGTDLLVDCACFTREQARLLVPYLGDVTCTVMISSKAVYVDEQGRHSNSIDEPDFGAPIRETQPTVAAGGGDPLSREGYGANKIAAENELLDTGAPVSVLRAGKVHGPGAARPREWVYLKRILDEREAVVLARRGETVDQTTAAANLAALVATVAASPGTRVLNAADPDAPSSLEIARAVAAHAGWRWEEVLVDGDSPGANPWSVAHPVVLDTSAARELGWQPAGTFAETVTDALDWLRDAADGGADADRVPGPDDPFFSRFLDYAAEDAFLLRRQLGL
jgi:nucleoside-diphosphate-sugar epimerase